MKNQNRFTLIFVGLSILTKYLLFYLDFPMENQRKAMVLFHLFFILSSVFFAIKNVSNKIDFLENFKSGSKAALIYAISISAFILLFYNYVDTGYFVSMQNEIIKTQIIGAKADDIPSIKKNIQSFFTVFNYTTITLTGFIVLGVLFSVIISLVKKYTNA